VLQKRYEEDGLGSLGLRPDFRTIILKWGRGFLAVGSKVLMARIYCPPNDVVLRINELDRVGRAWTGSNYIGHLGLN